VRNNAVDEKMNKKIIAVILIVVLVLSVGTASAWAKEEKMRIEADYTPSCQYIKDPQHPAYGAINNVYGDPTWVVPRENDMAILGSVVASESLNDTSYPEQARSDGAWYANAGGDQTIAYGWSCAEKTTVATQGNVGIDNNTIVVDIKLLNIPPTLTFDQDFTPDNICEYEWSIYIDADNNPSTGLSWPIDGCEVSISLMNFKSNGSTQHNDTILGGTQHNTWIFGESGCFSYGHEIDATINYSTNTITMIASKEWEELSDVDETDRFYFSASYRCAADKNSRDITSCSEGRNAITDPEGDVPYGFIDILQGSLDVSQTPEPVNKGDLNSDGYITPADAAIALRLAATAACDQAADVSGDKRVTALDALMILQAAAGAVSL
jgi:hypothetical protein